MTVKLPARRRAAEGSARRPRRAARLTALVAGIAAPALIGAAALAGPASASSGFDTHITPNNTLGLLLDVSGGSTDNGAPVIDYFANGGANQRWTFVRLDSNNDYEIINDNSGKCLTTDGVAGDQVYQFQCVGAATQQWRTNLNPGNVNAYPIQSMYGSRLYLEVSGNTAWPGAAIDTWYWNGGSNQYFAAI